MNYNFSIEEFEAPSTICGRGLELGRVNFEFNEVGNNSVVFACLEVFDVLDDFLCPESVLLDSPIEVQGRSAIFVSDIDSNRSATREADF